MLSKGDKIGEYTLLEKLGSGGFGDVWKAEKRTALDVNHFALKFFRPKDDRIDFEKIGKELAVWKQLRGLPHIISVIELDQFEDYIYLVSDFADGGSLEKWLKDNGGKASSEEKAVKITLQILTGLENLHQKGFVHRDLKPDNILIMNGKFCLADFGITREVKSHSKATGTAGTMEYMPPEAFDKTPSVTTQTDIWAIGTILQRLLTGGLPYPQDDQPSLIAAILMSEPEPMPSNVSEGLREVVKKALQKQRGNRFQTAREMGEALRNSHLLLNKTPKPKPVSSSTIIDEDFDKTEVLSPNINRSITGEKQCPNCKGLFEDDKRFCHVDGTPLVSVEDWQEIKTEKQRQFEVVGQSQDRADKYYKISREKEQYQEGGEKSYDQTIKHYDKEIELNSNDAVVYYNRGTVFDDLGNYDLAIADYKKVLEIDPNFENAKENIRKIREKLRVMLEDAKKELKVKEIEKESLRKQLSTEQRKLEEIQRIKSAAEDDRIVTEADKLLLDGLLWQKYQARPQIYKNSIGMEFVKISSGSFMMGSPITEKDRSDNERQHLVTISKDFYMGKYEVTQAQWKAIMGNNPSSFKGNNLPVENVSWEDAQEFIKKLNAKGEGTYRLPTEAEWEYAARGGNSGKWCFGDDENESGKYAWDSSNAGSKTHEVGMKQPNNFGLYDMHGNVWEWCQDWYGDYSSSAQTDPTGATSGSRRVIRGGSWRDGARFLRSANRNSISPLLHFTFLGFRLIRAE